MMIGYNLLAAIGLGLVASGLHSILVNVWPKNGFVALVAGVIWSGVVTIG